MLLLALRAVLQSLQLAIDGFLCEIESGWSECELYIPSVFCAPFRVLPSPVA